MKIKTIIADDEPLALEKIRTLLKDDSEIEVIGECENGLDTLRAIQKHKPELLFLDVQMPELDGFGVLESIAKSRMPTIIFVTAYDKYALRAFEVYALDYLLKPFDRKRFEKALLRAKTHIRKEKASGMNTKLIALLEDLKLEKDQNYKQKYLERLVIKSSGRVIFLKSDEIDWIEAAGNYVRLHISKESHLMRDTMNDLESKLDPEKFLRIHRSKIVRIDCIKELQSWFNGEFIITLQNGIQLTSSRTYRHKFGKLMESSS